MACAMAEPARDTDYATKADLDVLRADLNARFAELRADVERMHGDTRADVGELRGEVRAMRWTVSLVGLGIALLMLALRLIGG